VLAELALPEVESWEFPEELDDDEGARDAAKGSVVLEAAALPARAAA
jgi:hypothetical protein